MPRIFSAYVTRAREILGANGVGAFTRPAPAALDHYSPEPEVWQAERAPHAP